MRIVNRFVELSFEYADNEIPIDRVFKGADLSESVSVVEAMYVIAGRRAASGNPVSINEITQSIPALVEDKSVLDAAIDICVEGLIDQGHSQDKAYQIILESTGSSTGKEQIEQTADIAAFIEHSALSVSTQTRRLPIDFGKHEHDGRKRYELRRFVGSGAHGNIFAEDSSPSLVALKIAHDTESSDRSMLEGARARRVRHKNVARVHDCGVSDADESYVVYEFIDGLPLDAWIKNLRSPLSIKEACRIVMDLADGIQTAHNAGVVHRDLKPSNILMTRENVPIITDFGIAHTSTSDPRLCSFYGTRGSLAFMAPEQYHGTNDGVTPSVDIYALGGLLYWLISGRFPNGETVADALVRLDIRNEGGDERKYSSQIHQRLRCIIERSLSVDLTERYNSASLLAMDIDSFINKQPIVWHDKSWLAKTALFIQRNPLVVLLNFILMGLFGMVVAVWVSSQSQIQLEKTQSKAELEIQQIQTNTALVKASLNKQIELEQERVGQLRERNLMAQNMLKAWSQAANNRDDESITMSNILFLYTVSESGFLDSDQDTAEQILNQRVRIAQEYLETLTPANSSPILRAQWHEMLGRWHIELQDSKTGKEHLGNALRLITEHAPKDSVWINNIESLIRQ